MGNPTTKDSPPEFVAQEYTGLPAKPNMARQLRRLLLLGAAVGLVVLFVAASRYQPLSITPGVAYWKTRGTSTEVKVSLNTTLSSSGPFGVDVTALRPKAYADPPLVVAPLRPCFRYLQGVRWCAQDKSGYFIGNTFHPFTLTGSNSIPIVWQYSFSCLPYPEGGESSLSGPVEVRVNYRFGFFTHQVLLVLSGNEVAPPSQSGPCAPVG